MPVGEKLIETNSSNLSPTCVLVPQALWLCPCCYSCLEDVFLVEIALPFWLARFEVLTFMDARPECATLILSWVAQPGVQISGGWEPWAFSISLSIKFLNKTKTISWALMTELSCWEINHVGMSTRSMSKEISWKAAGNTQMFELNHRFLQIKHYMYSAFSRGTDSVLPGNKYQKHISC